MARSGPNLLRGAAALVAALSMIWLSAGAAAAAGPTVLAAGATVSATILDPIDLNPKPAGYTTALIAHVTPNTATGTVTFYDDNAGTRTVLGSGVLGPDAFIAGVITASYTVPADQAAGTYHVIAVYEGDDTFAGSESAPAQTFTVGPRPSVTHIAVSGVHDASGATAQKGDVESVTVTLTDGGPATSTALTPNGTISVLVDGVVKGAPAIGSPLSLATAGLTLGVHTIRAQFTSSDVVFANSAAEAAITIVSNQVEAIGSAPSLTTFYPYPDKFKDTTALRGVRYETASVTVRIYSAATGKLVRTLSVPSGTGSWSTAWNGRNTAGNLVAAGKYNVRQTVRDAIGASKTLPTVSVNVSLKRIYIHKVTLKKSLSQRSAGVPANGWVGWRFTLPSAAVYKKLVFGVYGRTNLPAGLFGPHDYRYCPSSTWNWYSCMAPFSTFPTSLGWKSVTGSVTRNRSGTVVRMYAVGGNHTAVGYARVVVTYGVLR